MIDLAQLEQDYLDALAVYLGDIRSQGFSLTERPEVDRLEAFVGWYDLIIDPGPLHFNAKFVNCTRKAKYLAIAQEQGLNALMIWKLTNV